MTGSGPATRRSTTRSPRASRSRPPGGALLDRREPLRPCDRGRRARGPVGRAARGAVRAHRQPGLGTRSGRGDDRLRGGRARLARRRGAAARRVDREAERARRAVRDRADRHDREPRRRDQEPRGLRGAGRDRPDPGALGARGRRADQGRGADQARPGAALDRARLRGALVQPGARGDRRVRRQDAGARRGRGTASSCGRTPPSSPAAARRTCSTRRQLASYGTGETFPHAAAEGFIKISSLEVELAAARARAKTKA